MKNKNNNDESVHKCLKEADILGIKKDTTYIQEDERERNKIIKKNVDAINQLNLTLEHIQTVMENLLDDKDTWEDRKWYVILQIIIIVSGAIIVYLIGLH